MQPGRLSFDVPSIAAEFSSNGDMIIFATLQLTDSLRLTNQVWQEGPMNGGNPGEHPTNGQNGKSMGTVDFINGSVTTTGGTTSKQRKRNVSGWSINYAVCIAIGGCYLGMGLINLYCFFF
jgi:hypothetical protein